MSNNPILSYQQASARGATPIGQIIALYDTILRDFMRALTALKARDIETRIFELNHALTVIGHLQIVLDHERGGGPAKQFERFYEITREMITQAAAKATPESIEELISLYGGVRQAWYQAEQKLAADQQPEQVTSRPRVSAATTAPDTTNDDVETPQLQWSA